MQAVNIKAENTFTFSDDELRVLHGILYYHACDTDDMTPEAAKLAVKMNKQFQKMHLDSDLEVWK